MTAQHSKSIALTPELDRWVDDLVAAGEYKSASEVLREGLRALRERRERHEVELEAIRMRLSLSVDQAVRGLYARGSGEEAVRRAFKTGLKRAKA